MIALLKVPELRRFYVAHAQSQLGTGAAYVALLLVAYQRLHSPWAITVVLLADFIPGIVLSPVCGVLADRLPRRNLAVGADLLRAAAFTGLAVTSSFIGTVGFALLAGVGTALFEPALSAALPSLTTEQQRSPATALYSALNHVGITIGPGITAVVLLFSGPVLVLVLNAATFVVSAALLFRVPLGRAERDDEERAASVWVDTRDGVQATRRIAGLRMLLFVGAVAVLAGGMMNVAEPLLATRTLHSGNSGFAILVAVYGAGMVAAARYNAAAGTLIGGLRRRWLIAIALSGAAMSLTALAPDLPVAMVAFALTGLANSLLLGPEIRLTQEMVSDRLLGRVFGLRALTQNVAFVAAVIGSGALLGLLGVRAVYAIAGVTLLALSPLAALLFHPAESASDPAHGLPA